MTTFQPLPQLLLNTVMGAHPFVADHHGDDLTGVQRLMASDPVAAAASLDAKPELRDALALGLSEMPATIDTMRLRRFVADRGGFSIPASLFVESAPLTDILRDSDIHHRAYLALRGSIPSTPELLGELKRWNGIFEIEIPKDGKTGVVLQRLAPLKTIERTLLKGYDPGRKPTQSPRSDYASHMIVGNSDYRKRFNIAPDDVPWIYFLSTKAFDGDSMVNYGMNNIEAGCVVAVEHSLTFSRLMTFLCAAAGHAYVASGELGFTGAGADLFNATLAHPEASSSARFYAHRESPKTEALIGRLVEGGVAVHYDRGATLSAAEEITSDLEHGYRRLFGASLDEVRKMSEYDLAWSVINATETLPENVAGTDKLSEASFHFLLLSFPPEEGIALLEAMVAENEEMAERAAKFYASIEGFALPVFERWSAQTSEISNDLRNFFDRIRASRSPA